jgi:hypothetical protein
VIPLCLQYFFEEDISACKNFIVA